MEIRIASFNVKNLADGQGRDIQRIARIINENKLDIVCLQEVLQEGKIISGISLKGLSGQAKAYDRSLKSKLQGTWDSEWKQPKLRRYMEKYLGGDKRGEGYAILWRTDRRRLSLPKDEYGKEIRPTIYSNYDIRFADSKLRLIRDPLYARFIVGNRPAELRIISTHIIYGKSEAVKDILDYGAVEMRRKEFDLLAGQIYYRISEMHKDIQCTSPYTVMLGDYNLNIRSETKNQETCNIGGTLPQVKCYDKKGRAVKTGHVASEENKVFTVLNLQEEKTTLKKNAAELANSYDHFTVNEETKKRIVPNSIRVIDAIHEHNEESDLSEEALFDTYRKQVSDHLPIVVSIQI